MERAAGKVSRVNVDIAFGRRYEVCDITMLMPVSTPVSESTEKTPLKLFPTQLIPASVSQFSEEIVPLYNSNASKCKGSGIYAGCQYSYSNI
jgi:hypothetical protein